MLHFSWLNSHMWQKTSCKMSAKHLRFSWWHINLPLWTKQPNILLSSCRSEYIFSIGSMKDDRSFKCRRWKQNRGVTLSHHTHFLACLVTMLRGGVTGRLPLGFFFSAGFKIYKRNIYRVGNVVGKHIKWKSFPFEGEQIFIPNTISDPNSRF